MLSTNSFQEPKHEKSFSRPFLIKLTCNVRSMSCLLLFIAIFFSSFFSWTLAFIAGLLSTLDSVENVRSVQMKYTRLSLERSLLLPHQVALQAHLSGIAANSTMDILNYPMEQKYRIHQSLSAVSRLYRPLLPGMAMYMGTVDGHFFVNNYNGESKSGPSSPDGIVPGQHRWFSTRCAAYETNCFISIEDVIVYDYHRLDFEVVSSMTFPSDLYPSDQSWFNVTMQRQQPIITDPFPMIGRADDGLGLAYTYPTYAPNGKLLGIYAIDYFLDGFSETLSSIAIGRKANGHLFVASRKEKVIASSRANVTYLDDDGIDQQYLATDLQDSTQRKAAQIIARKWGFENVQDGASATFDAMIFDVVILDVVYNNISLLQSDCDYFVLFTWLNSVSVAATMIAILFSLVSAVVWFSLCLTNPLRSIGRKMELIQDMDLDNIHIGRKALIQEIYSIQQSFEFTISKLKEYRAFLPAYLLEKNSIQDEKVSVHSDQKSAISSVRSSKESQSQNRVFQSSKFSNALSYQSVSLVVIQILNFKEIFGMKPREQSQFLQIYAESMKTIKQFASSHGGMLESFDQEKFVFSYLSDLTVVLQTVENVMKQIELKFKNWNQSELKVLPRFGIGFDSGEIISGVLGSDKIKKKLIFGNVLDSVLEFAEKNKSWKSTKILCSAFVIQSLKRIGVKLVYRQIEENLYEIVERDTIKNDEWMYELQQKRLKERFESYKQGYKFMEKKDYQSAIVRFKKFLEESPDDYPGIHYLSVCTQMTETES